MNSSRGDGGNDIPILIRKGPDCDQEAIDWHIWLRSGDADAADRVAFERWHEDDRNAAAYFEVDMIWNGLGEVLTPMAGAVPLRSRRRFVQRFGPRLAAMAASLLVAMGAGYQYLNVWRYDYVAPGTNRFAVTLPDRSRVVLDADAAIDVDYADGVRRVSLARGEAFFDVRHNAAKPFVVDAGGGEIHVLGTAFSVAREGANGRVIVLRGSVRVQAGTMTTDVVPNQTISFGPAGNKAVIPIDAKSALGWSSGQLFFKNVRLGDVIAQLDRYYPGVILLRNRREMDRRISAVVRIDGIDEWLSALGRTQHLTVRRYPFVTTLS